MKSITEEELARLHDEVARQANPAQSWKPEPGDQLSGVVVDRRREHTNHGDEVDVVDVQTEDDGTLAVWGTPAVLKRLISDKDPQCGDFILVKYHGMRPARSGREFKHFGLAVHKATSEEQPSRPVSGSPPPAPDEGTLEISNKDVPF